MKCPQGHPMIPSAIEYWAKQNYFYCGECLVYYHRVPEKGDIWRHKETELEFLILEDAKPSDHHSKVVYVTARRGDRSSGDDIIEEIRIETLQERYFCRSSYYDRLMDRVKELMDGAD